MQIHVILSKALAAAKNLGCHLWRVHAGQVAAQILRPVGPQDDGRRIMRAPSVHVPRQDSQHSIPRMLGGQHLRYRCIFAVAGICVVTLLSVSAHAQIGVDRVQLRNGVESGKIIDTNALGVTLSKGGVSSKIPAEEIRSITFGEEPPELGAARRAMGRLRFDSALTTLGRVDTKQLGRSEVRQDYDFLLAACRGHLALAGEGDLKQATAEVNNFTTRNRTSFHVTEVLELHGDLLLAAGDKAGARKKYETLAKAPNAYYKMRSAILVGRLLQETGDFAGALEQFAAALKLFDGSAVTKPLVFEAQLGEATNLAATDKMGETKSKIRHLASGLDPDDTTALAQTYNALGDAFRLAGNSLAARDTYLHVELLFPDEKEPRAEALARLAKLWEELRQPTRAQQARDELEDEFPASRWRGR